MTLPGAADVLATLEATWPPATVTRLGPVRLRIGAGGGKRVSAATVAGAAEPRDIDRAEAAMRDAGQTPLFMLTPAEVALDTALASRGYGIVDPTVLYANRSAPGVIPTPVEASTTGLATLWDDGGIGPERRAVMDRVSGRKSVLVPGDPEHPEAALFVALGAGGAMFHALHVAPEARRRGLGRTLTRGAVAWAAAEGAPWIALAVTEANRAANALYASLGFKPVGRYHYRTLGG
ncbi:MAG: GNAT family N-acetyltransferase [Paracoccaceae bacterium]|nr:GNAT family N-acetyltransferase [Paracoccaceae bacterium]